MLNRFKRHTTAIATMLALTALPLTPIAHSASAASAPLSVPIVGMVAGGGTFSGVLSLTSFAVQNGQVVANATISGLLTTAAGAATGVLQTVTMPVAVGQTSCQILHLDLGPLSLNVLGLQVDLSEVVLDITAQPGSGNLLGNLLCAVAGLLDNPSGLSKLLNQILAAL